MKIYEGLNILKNYDEKKYKLSNKKWGISFRI